VLDPTQTSKTIREKSPIQDELPCQRDLVTSVRLPPEDDVAAGSVDTIRFSAQFSEAPSGYAVIDSLLSASLPAKQQSFDVHTNRNLEPTTLVLQSEPPSASSGPTASSEPLASAPITHGVSTTEAHPGTPPTQVNSEILRSPF
jgi:hypothetical protein